MTHAANVYGQALYGLARDEGLARQILDELTVLQESFSSEPGFTQLLCTPSIPRQERLRILDSTLGGRIHPYVLNFLKILTGKGYIRHFPDCCDTFRRIFNRDNGIVQVTAYTALPLSDALRRQLTAKLSGVTGKTIELDCRLDPEALGGIRLDFDGKQVDGTIRRRLEDLRSILKNCVL